MTNVAAMNHPLRTLAVGSMSVMWHSTFEKRNDSTKDWLSRAATLLLENLIATPRIHSTTTRLDDTAHPSKTFLVPVEWGKSLRREATEREAKQYDFAVIGNGLVGRVAVESLRQQCPSATIALCDPMATPLRATHGVEFYPERAIGLSPRERLIQLEDSEPIRYKSAVLIATGSRGAAPPSYLMDEAARDRVLELKTTIIPFADQQRPVDAADVVRQLTIKASADKKRVGILGSGWDAIDMAVAAAAKSAPRASKPMLVFGSLGPLPHVLPSYLSALVAKRLRSKKINVCDRTLVRYISSEGDDASSRLQLFTSKSYDYLDSHVETVDLIVVAPEVSGPRGSAVIPTEEIPDELLEKAAGRSWYQTWSNLTMLSARDPGTVVCYKDDGRIAVNTELCACSGVYAAGSVAKCANGLTGHADVTGLGVEDSVAAGQVAAENMARLFHAQNKSSFSFSGQSNVEYDFATKDPLTVWRSDIRSLNADGSLEPTTLADIGISALCVGNCDSQGLSTHGVWWTNSAAHRRWLRLRQDHYDKQGRPRRRHTTKVNSLQPIYGMGVVYYLDRTGAIQGIMAWGLPFTMPGMTDLNRALVEHMKDAILSNGGFGSIETEVDQTRQSDYLASLSRLLVATAMGAGDTDETWNNLPRPLHRFTEVRPPSVRGLGVLKRKDGHGQGMLGQDLFARRQGDFIKDPPSPPPTTMGRPISTQARALHEWNVWEHYEKLWDENESLARPPKEDPLWIRKGDETRNIAFKETVTRAYATAIGR